MGKYLIYSLCIFGITFSQLIPGKISIAGYGYTEDQSDREGYDKYNRTFLMPTISYNLNQSISIDSRFVLSKSDREYTDGETYENSDEIILVGGSYFLKNNLFFSLMTGLNKYESSWSSSDQTGTCAAFGYRLKLSPAVSIDIGYYVYDWEEGNRLNQFEFLIRMFL